MKGFSLGLSSSCLRCAKLCSQGHESCRPSLALRLWGRMSSKGLDGNLGDFQGLRPLSSKILLASPFESWPLFCMVSKKTGQQGTQSGQSLCLHRGWVGVVCGHDAMLHSGLHLCLNPQKDKRSRDRPEVPLKCLEQSLLREHPRSTRGGERGCVCLSSSNLCCRVWRISTPSQGPVRKQETQSANGSVSEYGPW